MNQAQGYPNKGSGSTAMIQKAFQTLPAGSLKAGFASTFQVPANAKSEIRV
ncbi:hypothetical protein [Bordetella trematum]|uniref:hypothetical protein n=1 Tax=Bordetella trematum TaxID=123899 RepID=UPI00163C7C7F|nr:hypothetical protein [Bordetella trematum]